MRRILVTGTAGFVGSHLCESLIQNVKRAAAAFHRPSRDWLAPTTLMRVAGKLVGKTSAVDRLLGSLAVDISNIQRVLVWRPLFSVADSLQRTASWMEATA